MSFATAYVESVSMTDKEGGVIWHKISTYDVSDMLR